MKGGLDVLTRYLAKELSAARHPRQRRRPRPDPHPARRRRVRALPRGHPAARRRTALGRLGEADDVGMVIAALLSDEFGWVTGENIEGRSGGFNL